MTVTATPTATSATASTFASASADPATGGPAAAPLALPAPYGSCPYDPPPGYTQAAAEAPVSRAELPDGTPAGS